MSEDAPHYGPMTEQRAREILLGFGCEATWRSWIDANFARLDKAAYTADELEAIAWWMRNKGASDA